MGQKQTKSKPEKIKNKSDEDKNKTKKNKTKTKKNKNKKDTCKKFEYFEELPAEMQVKILSHCKISDLSIAAGVSYSIHNMIKKYKLLPMRKARNNKYCKYYTCNGQIVGLYVFYQPKIDCIFFTYCKQGEPDENRLYKYDVKTDFLYALDHSKSKSVSYNMLIPWKQCVRYNNPHAKAFIEIFSRTYIQNL
jgi:hypothetical protein